jgi:predicted DNA-binding antitoxin AbrB/MazE fold protein
MKEKGTPAPFEWPRWKYSSKWLTYIASILAIVVFFIPNAVFFIPNLKLKYRIILAIFFLLLPVLIQTFLLITKTIVIMFKRINYYPNLYNYYQNDCSKLREIIELFYYVNIKDKILEIKGAKYQKGDLYIVLKNNSKLNLKEGNKIIVIDKKDLVYLGQFEITEVRNSEYFAVGVRNIDPVWRGYVRQEGETDIMPNTVAIYLSSGE